MCVCVCVAWHLKCNFAMSVRVVWVQDGIPDAPLAEHPSQLRSKRGSSRSQEDANPDVTESFEQAVPDQQDPRCGAAVAGGLCALCCFGSQAESSRYFRVLQFECSLLELLPP